MAEVALITAYNGQGQLLVGKRLDNERYTLPGGHLEQGEDPAAGALRELYEETGLHAQSLSHLKEYTTKNGVRLHCFSAFVSGEPHGKNDPDHEVDKWEFIDVEEGLPPKVFNHLHGPQDDDNIVTQLFDLKKAEEMGQRVWHSGNNEIHIPSEMHPDRPAYDENHLNSVRSTYKMDVKPIKVGTEQLTTTLPISDHHRLDLYRRMFRSGERMPHVVVEKTASGYRVLDGNHKVHAARAEGGGQVDAVELIPDQMPPEIREAHMAKAEDEVYRLLDHPNPAERTMALKLDTLQPSHLAVAALDADPKVYSAAIDHAKFGALQGLNLMEAKQDKSGAYPLRQKNVFLQRAAKIKPYHLNAYINSARDERHDVYEAAADQLSRHPGTNDALLRRLYLDSSINPQLRTQLLGHPNTPADVLDNALDMGLMIHTPESCALAKVAVGHKNMLGSSLARLVHRAADRGEQHVVDIATHALTNHTVGDEVAKYLMTSSISKPASAAPQLLGALLSGPSGTREMADEAQKHLQPQALQHIMGSPHASPELVGRVNDFAQSTGNADLANRVMQHPMFGNQHLAQMVKNAEDVLSKSIDAGAKELARHPVISAQLGFEPAQHPAFRAARFLAMGAQITDEDERNALYHEDGDIERAALLAYGLPDTEENLESLRAVMEIRDVRKGEMDGSVPVTKAVTAHPEGKDVGESIERAVKDSFVFPVALGGKHSNGSMLAYDEDTQTTWLLKSGSGGAGGAAGSKQDPSNPNAREAAFYYVAKEWGIEKHFPRAELVLLNDQPFAALTLLPLNYKNLDEREREAPGIARRILHPFLHDGTLHQWAVIDYVLGNPDRHGQNVMVNPKQDVRLIDHGSAFAGDMFDPAHDQNSFVPYYLRAWHLEGSFNQKSSDEKLKGLPRVAPQVAHQLAEWIGSINADKLTEICKRYGINWEPTLTRLGKLQVAASNEPADLAINKLWVTT